MAPQLVLASTSPRRSALLTQIGIQHRIIPVDIDETPRAAEDPLAYVHRMAAEKSAAVRLGDRQNLPVLAADTSVICDGRILGKPESLEQAREMFALLSGRLHQVYTAVSLRGTRHTQAVSISAVKFRTVHEAEIVAYWRTGEPCDKAGGYAIQGMGSIFIESISGSFSGIMGLPLFETAELLAQQGISVFP
jgi:septum formation protein